MDDRRFDQLTRGLAGASRRRVLRGLAGGALGAVLTRFGVAGTAAQEAEGFSCRLNRARCRGNFDCCEGSFCGPPNAAGERRCRCEPGFLECQDRRCRDVRDDDANCGACGRVCRTNTTCCAGRCADIGFDPANCGRCGLECEAGDVCRVGRCCTDIYATCNPNEDRCCGASTCSGRVRGERTCCALRGLKCGDDGQCCSGTCGADGNCT